jgi:hypothetical protein
LALAHRARQLSDAVPWEGFGKLDDESMTALYEYVRILQATCDWR